MNACVIYKLAGISYVKNILGMAAGFISGFCGFVCCVFLFKDEEVSIRLFFMGMSLLLIFMGILASKVVVKVRCYNDKFEICTRYVKQMFFFDKSEFRKLSFNAYGRCSLILQKERRLFSISEDDFPGIFKLLLGRYSESIQDDSSKNMMLIA